MRLERLQARTPILFNNRCSSNPCRLLIRVEPSGLAVHWAECQASRVHLQRRDSDYALVEKNKSACVLGQASQVSKGIRERVRLGKTLQLLCQYFLENRQVTDDWLTSTHALRREMIATPSPIRCSKLNASSQCRK